MDLTVNSMLGILLYAFLLHLIADFFLQSREMGKRKSTDFSYLLAHVGIQFATVFIGMVFAVSIKNAFLISFFNAIVHGAIDWHIWRGYKYLAHIRLSKAAAVEALNMVDWNVPYDERYSTSYTKLLREFKYWEDHWFYATIGVDQFLHISTLTIVLFKILPYVQKIC